MAAHDLWVIAPTLLFVLMVGVGTIVLIVIQWNLSNEPDKDATVNDPCPHCGVSTHDPMGAAMHPHEPKEHEDQP